MEQPLYIKIPKGTVLYRTSFTSGPLAPTKCGDTDKVGLYFATVPAVALGMALEYKSNMYFNTFELRKPIIAIDGKYNFRMIHPERYFDRNNNFICNVDLIPSENVNHFEAHVYPIIRIDGLESYRFLRDEKPTDGELFIKKGDLKKVRLMETHTVDWRLLAKSWMKKQPFSRKEMFYDVLDKSA
jgi:hypothetical protein